MGTALVSEPAKRRHKQGLEKLFGNLNTFVGSTTTSSPVSVGPTSAASAALSPQRVPLAGPVRPQVVNSPRSSASTTAGAGPWAQPRFPFPC